MIGNIICDFLFYKLKLKQLGIPKENIGFANYIKKALKTQKSYQYNYLYPSQIKENIRNVFNTLDNFMKVNGCEPVDHSLDGIATNYTDSNGKIINPFDIENKEYLPDEIKSLENIWDARNKN